MAIENNEELLDASWEAGQKMAEEAASVEESDAADDTSSEEVSDEVETSDSETEPDEVSAEQDEEATEPTVEPEVDADTKGDETTVAQESSEEGEVGDEDKLGKLEKLAKELGYEFNGEKVQNAHFVKLRHAAKAQKEKLEARAAEKARQLEDTKAQLQAMYKPYEEMRAAAESGDFDALAKSLGHENFQNLAMSYANGNTREGGQMLKMRREMESMRQQQAQYQQQAQQAAAGCATELPGTGCAPRAGRARTCGGNGPCGLQCHGSPAASRCCRTPPQQYSGSHGHRGQWVSSGLE